MNLLHLDLVSPHCLCLVSMKVSTVTYTKQMDIHTLYFNETTKLVERSYLGSQFMGHATHTDTMDDFKEAHKGLDIVVHNPEQLSMDGPNVNWKFAETC